MGDDDDFAAMFEASVQGPGQAVRKLKAGQRVEGTIVAISKDTIFVDLGTRTEARLARSAVTDAKGNLSVAVGERIQATIARPEGRGAAELKLSLGGGGADELRLALEAGTSVEGEFSKAVKGGLEVDIGGTRAFCPASHVDLAYVKDLEVYVGQTHAFKVIEIRDRGRSIVVSRKAALQEARAAQAEEVLGSLEPGAELEGVVQTLQNYGAFVDIGGVQGLVHVSEISHARVSSPADALAVGEKVRVKVISVDRTEPDNPRISLSMKALVQRPESPGGNDDEQNVLTATVSKVESFGVMVETSAGVGLVPNGDLDLPRGSDPRRAFKPGDTLEVVVARRDPSGKLRFSAKAVREVEEHQAYRSFSASQKQKKGKGGDKLGSLGDLLKGIELPDGKR